MVHLAIYLAASFTLYFLRDEGLKKRALSLRALDWLCAAGTVAGVVHILLNLDRILASWGADYLTTGDIFFGAILVLVVLEAANFFLRAVGPLKHTVSGGALTLSAVSVVLLLFNGWMGWEMVYRRHVGIADAGEVVRR
jgi:TRAP-type uncharacterized transport system fused permease subunit